MENPIGQDDVKMENFRMYHQLQFDRMDKLESKRESFSNLVITLSIGILTFGFSNEFKVEDYMRIILSGTLMVINGISIKFIQESHILFKMHQDRAKIALQKFAPDLIAINSEVGKKDSSLNMFSRKKLYIFLHVLFIMIGAIISIIKIHPMICSCNH